MAELPTKEELEQLYHEKGHDALVWYAWRCALRSSLVIGRLPLHKVWPKNTVKHAWRVFSSNLVLAHYRKDSELIHYIAHECEEAWGAISYDNAGESVSDIGDAICSIRSAYISTYLTTPDYAHEASWHSYQANKLFASHMRNDYFFLKRNLEHQTSRTLHQRQPKELFFESRYPKNILSYQRTLLQELADYNLEFLAKDLRDLWYLQPLKKHTKNYLNKISSTIVNDPTLLSDVVIGVNSSTEKMQTVRVLLLGPGGAGKSSLRDRLLGRPAEDSLNKKATTGIEYEWLDKTVLRKINPKLKLSNQLKLRLWDFGGQTIFHGLHRAFLHENCVYVLVVDSRHEQAPDNWLYQIQDLTGNEKPQVLIVTNRYEHCDTRQNEVRLLREFPDLLGSQEQFFYFSCHQSNEPQFKAFIQALIDQSMNSRHQVLKLAMDVQRKMKVDFKDQTFLRKNRIKSLIPSHLVEEFHGTVVNHLDQLGYMIPVEKGEMIYCLKPEWAVKNAYNLVHSKALRDKGGIAPTDVLEETLEDKVGGTEIDYLIRFLHSRHLCQKLSNNKYFFPDSAPANEPTVVRELQETENRLELRFDLPFLPLGIHTRFISQLFHNNDDVTISEAGAIWRQGFILQSGDAKASVQYQWRKSCIEITMAGDVERFADILNAFHNALNFVLKGGYLKEADVQPYVVYGSGQIYSIHSSAALADKLREITRIEELFPKVQAMAAEKVINIGEGGTYNEGGDSSQFATNSENFTQNNQPQTLSLNEQETLQDVVKALRDNLNSFETEQQIAVLQTQKALESPQDEKSVQLLGKAYQGLLKNVDGLATFTKDKAIPIADFAIKNKESLAAAATALTVAIGA